MFLFLYNRYLGEMMKIKRYLLLIVILCCFLFPTAGIGAENIRQHKGEKEISFSAYLTSGEETNWRMSISAGYFLSDTVIVGGELYIISSEGAGEDDDWNTYSILKAHILYHFPTSEESLWEPFLGIQAGSTFGEEQQLNVGSKVGINFYFSQDFGLALSHELVWFFDDEEFEHNFVMELFYQFD